MDKTRTSRRSLAWQEQAVEYAHIMSQVKWTPVADGMLTRKGVSFEKGRECIGVPYSSVKFVGRYIGFDIFLKTFLAAVENPLSVLYTETLFGKQDNAAAYYGKVCSSFTSYALQCGIWYVSRLHGPAYRNGVHVVTPAAADTAALGDIIFTPPCAGSHVEMVTEITRDNDGAVTHVRTEESWPPTTRTIERAAADFNTHISSKDRKLYRITDLDAWRGKNRAESFRFPDYEDDATTPVINRVLLLDRGDWVPYHQGQPVRINVMDRDAVGVKTLVIKRGEELIEEVEVQGTGVIERSFSACGDYTVQCVLADGVLSQACEFSVSDLDFSEFPSGIAVNEAWEIAFRSENMDVILVYLSNDENRYAQHSVVVTEHDRRRGKVVIPAELVQDPGNWQVVLIGENRYGRLKKRRDLGATGSVRTEEPRQ